MKEKKLKEFEESLESGILSKEEYEERKKEIEAIVEKMPEEEKIEEKTEEKNVQFKSDKALVIGIVAVLLVLAVILSLPYFTKEKPRTIDDLHELNLKGKLKPEQGYVYNDIYSFVKFDGLWYTQFLSPQGSRFYNIQFRYGPKDVESVKIKGFLNAGILNNATDYYVTFNPTGKDFASVALAVGDFNEHMTKIFFKKPIAACDRNETLPCKERPIITCDNTDKMVLYVKEANATKVSYGNNCITVEGSGFELVKGIDRVLFNFYGVIDDK
ncbi:hypothetical protein HYX01_03470 [Candidatus Woesearchaeota archaeon]|nr:hypothetical protein [Candidatus Woesearchaeota archaeon]